MGLLALRLEINGGYKMRVKMLVADLFKLDYFFKGAFVNIVRPVRAVHYQIPLAARHKIHGIYGIGKAIRPPPVSNMFGFGPYFPYQVNRSIKRPYNT